MMKNREIHFVVNTPSSHEAREDEVQILSAAEASVKAIRSLKNNNLTVKSIQEYHG